MSVRKVPMPDECSADRARPLTKLAIISARYVKDCELFMPVSETYRLPSVEFIESLNGVDEVAIVVRIHPHLASTSQSDLLRYPQSVVRTACAVFKVVQPSSLM